MKKIVQIRGRQVHQKICRSKEGRHHRGTRWTQPFSELKNIKPRNTKLYNIC